MTDRRVSNVFEKLRSKAAAVKTVTALLTQAESIARARGLDRPGAEHLVLAALELPDGTAPRTMERLGTSAAAFEAALEAQAAEDLATVGVRAPIDGIEAALPPAIPSEGIYRSDPSAQQLFQLAGDARRGGGQLLGAHVLRAAADLGHGPTARALRRMQIDPASLRDAATAEIEDRSGPTGAQR